MKTKHLLIIFFSLLFVNVVYGASLNNNCNVRFNNCNAGEQAIFSISDATNAHAAQDPSYYNYKVCCSVSNYQTFGNSCSTGLFTLSDIINAHVSKNDYSNKICLVSQGENGVSCDIKSSCGSGEYCVVSVSDTTNAHVASCSDSAYTNKLCCRNGAGLPAGVVGIRVSPSQITLMVGDREPVKVYEIYDDGHEEIVEDLSLITFISNNNALVTVNNFGLLSAIAQGSATITADYYGLTANTAVTVIARDVNNPVVSYCETKPTTATIEVGQTEIFFVDIHYTAGKETEYDQKADSYSSTDTSIATIDSNGVARGINAGNTNINSNAKGKQCSYADLTVIETGETTELSNIEVEPEEDILNIGVIENYKVTAFYSDETSKLITDNTYTKYDVIVENGINVVQEISKGSFKCVSAGDVTIRASYSENGKTVGDEAHLTCRSGSDVIYSRLEIKPKLPRIAKGGAIQFNSFAYYSDGSRKDITSLNLGKISAVNLIGLGTVLTSTATNGLFNANEIGEAKVTGLYKENNIQKTDSTRAIVVSEAEQAGPSYVELIPSSASVKIGISRKFNLILVYSNGFTEDVTNSAVFRVKDILAIGGTPVATYLGNGEFRGENLGLAEVIGSYQKDGIAFYDKGSLAVISDREISHLELDPSKATINLGSSIPYLTRVFYSDQQNGVDVTLQSIFNSKDIISITSADDLGPNVARHDGNGVFTGTKRGSAMITASYIASGITKGARAYLYVGNPAGNCQVTKAYWSRNPGDLNDENTRVTVDQNTGVFVNVETTCNPGWKINLEYSQTPPGYPIDNIDMFSQIFSLNVDQNGKATNVDAWPAYYYDAGLAEIVGDLFNQGPDYKFTATPVDDGTGNTIELESTNLLTVKKTATVPLGCNNGIVDENLGEECDPPGTTEGTKTCNYRCKWEDETPPPECTGSECSPGSGSSECSQQSYTKTYGGISGTYNGVCGVIDQCYNGERFSGRYSDCRSNQVCCKGVKGDSGTIRVNENGVCKPNPAKPGSAEGTMTQKICTINTQTNQKTCSPAQQVKCRLPLSGIKVSFFTLTNVLIVIGLIVIFYIVKSVSKKKVVKEVKKKRRKKRL